MRRNKVGCCDCCRGGGGWLMDHGCRVSICQTFLPRDIVAFRYTFIPSIGTFRHSFYFVIVASIFHTWIPRAGCCGGLVAENLLFTAPTE